MKEYKYKSPKEKGYHKIYLSNNEHNKYLKNKVRWYDRCEHYIMRKDDKLYMYVENIPKKSACILEMLCIPIWILQYGIIDLWKHIKDTWKMFINTRKYGKHTAYSFVISNKEFEALLENRRISMKEEFYERIRMPFMW